MTRKDFIFLRGLALGRPKKEQEIEQARARSHAAKAVHRRLKEIAHRCQQALVTGDEKYTVHAENWLQCHFWNGANSSVYAGLRGMRVDPFYCIPLSQDRNIAQVIDFGMSFSTVEHSKFANLANM